MAWTYNMFHWYSFSKRWLRKYYYSIVKSHCHWLKHQWIMADLTWLSSKCDQSHYTSCSQIIACLIVPVYDEIVLGLAVMQHVGGKVVRQSSCVGEAVAVLNQPWHPKRIEPKAALSWLMPCEWSKSGYPVSSKLHHQCIQFLFMKPFSQIDQVSCESQFKSLIWLVLFVFLFFFLFLF